MNPRNFSFIRGLCSTPITNTTTNQIKIMSTGLINVISTMRRSMITCINGHAKTRYNSSKHAQTGYLNGQFTVIVRLYSIRPRLPHATYRGQPLNNANKNMITNFNRYTCVSQHLVNVTNLGSVSRNRTNKATDIFTGDTANVKRLQPYKIGLMSIKRNTNLPLQT